MTSNEHEMISPCPQLVGIQSEARTGFDIGKEHDEQGIWRPYHTPLHKRVLELEKYLLNQQCS